MTNMLIIIALVNGHFSFNQQELSKQACFEAISSSRVNQRTSQFIFENANEGRVFGGCYLTKTDENVTGDPTGNHSLVINAIASGNFTTRIVEFGNQSACLLAANKVINTSTLLLNQTGDAGAIDAFCIDTGEELPEIDLFESENLPEESEPDAAETLDDEEMQEEIEQADPPIEGTIIAAATTVTGPAALPF